MPPLPFPVSSSPGILAGEGDGRLLNVYASKDGERVRWRRCPGLVAHAAAGQAPRGMLDLDGTTIVVAGTSVKRVALDGTVTTLAGSIPGTAGVTLARNNNPTPDVVAVREDGGAYVIGAATVSAYPDADLPATVNSVSVLGPYFVFTEPNARTWSSDLNTTAVNPLSFATAEGRPDGLVRGWEHAGSFYAGGSASIEFWLNMGTSPFPLQRIRSGVIPVGILTTMAIAGLGEGWDQKPCFVAHDSTVRELDGYLAEKIVSTDPVQRFIVASNKATLRAFTYTHAGHGFWCLTSNLGTWCLDVTTGAWHERTNAAGGGWRALMSVKSGGRWLFGDRLSTDLLRLDPSVRTERGEAIVGTAESGPLSDFPARVFMPSLFLDFTRAATDVTIEWSKDGGQTWKGPLTRSLEQANRFPVRANLHSLSTHHGLRARWTVSGDADFAFAGASIPDPQPRAP